MRQTADSTSAHRPPPSPPPAWLERIAPGTTARYSVQKSNEGPATSVPFLLLGFVVLVGFLGSTIGSLGWLGTMLLIFSASGRWLGETPVVSQLDESEPAVF